VGGKYPTLKPEIIIKILSNFGFEKISQKGSHAKYHSKDMNRTYIIPMHDEIATGTFKSILEQAGITLEEFLKFLRKN
jgi:predicted RNA binding protein YcfA (HicA-like mRNA interferase family)